jgi:hypothetical protein
MLTENEFGVPDEIAFKQSESLAAQADAAVLGWYLAQYG